MPLFPVFRETHKGNFQKKRGDLVLPASGKNMESLTVIIQLLLKMKITYMGFTEERKIPFFVIKGDAALTEALMGD